MLAILKMMCYRTLDLRERLSVLVEIFEFLAIHQHQALELGNERFYIGGDGTCCTCSMAKITKSRRHLLQRGQTMNDGVHRYKSHVWWSWLILSSTVLARTSPDTLGFSDTTKPLVQLSENSSLLPLLNTAKPPRFPLEFCRSSNVRYAGALHYTPRSIYPHLSAIPPSWYRSSS